MKTKINAKFLKPNAYSEKESQYKIDSSYFQVAANFFDCEIRSTSVDNIAEYSFDPNVASVVLES